MTWYIKDKVSEDEFVKICKNSNSMASAASTMGIHFNSFKKRAIELNCYNTNQSGKGMVKKSAPKYPLSEILDGKHPHFQTYKLKNRMLKEGLIENVCSNQNCRLSEWNGEKLNCELDHIDGDRTNHKIENLRMLCPNCHSQTETYRSKNSYKK